MSEPTSPADAVHPARSRARRSRVIRLDAGLVLTGAPFITKGTGTLADVAVDGVRSARVTRLTFSSISPVVSVTLDDHDVLRGLDGPVGARARERGVVLAFRLVLTVTARRRSIAVDVRVPGRLAIDPCDHHDLVRAYLAAAGFLRHADATAATRTDLH